MIHKFPPFSELHEIEARAGKFSSVVLSKTSYKISQLTKSIQPLEFHAIPALIGIIVGYEIEHLIKDGIIELIPGIGTVCSILSTIALAVAIIEIIEISNDEYENE
jgi:hypothetical protein